MTEVDKATRLEYILLNNIKDHLEKEFIAKHLIQTKYDLMEHYNDVTKTYNDYIEMLYNKITSLTGIDYNVLKKKIESEY